MATPEEIARFQRNMAQAQGGGITVGGLPQFGGAVPLDAPGAPGGPQFVPGPRGMQWPPRPTADLAVPLPYEQTAMARLGLELPMGDETMLAPGQLEADPERKYGGPADAEPAPDSDEVRARYNLSDAIDQNAVDIRGAKMGAQDATSEATSQFQAIYQQAMRTGQANPAAAQQYRQAKGEVGRLRGNLEGLLKEQTELIGAQTEAEVGKAKARAAGAQEIANQLKLSKEETIAENEEMAQATDAKFAEIDESIAQLKEMKVDPKRAFSSMGEGEKIAFGIAMMLSSVFAGKEDTDSMLGHIQGIVDRDVALQEKDFGRKRQVLGEQRQQMRDVLSGLESKQARNDKTRAIGLEAAAAMTEAQAAKYDAPEAKAKGQQLAVALRQRAAEFNMAAKADEMNAGLKSMHTRQANLGAALGAAQGIQQGEAQVTGESPAQKLQRIQVEKFGKEAGESQSGLESVTNLIDLIKAKGDPGVINKFLAGGLTERLFVGDDDAETMRNIQDLQNKLLADLSGAAISEHEFKRFEKAMDEKYLTAETRMRLLTRMARQLENKIRRSAATYGGGKTRAKFKEQLASVEQQTVGAPRSMER